MICHSSCRHAAPRGPLYWLVGLAVSFSLLHAGLGCALFGVLVWCYSDAAPATGPSLVVLGFAAAAMGAVFGWLKFKRLRALYVPKT